MCTRGCCEIYRESETGPNQRLNLAYLDTLVSVGPKDWHVFRGHVEVDYIISRGTASNHTELGAPSQPGMQCHNCLTLNIMSLSRVQLEGSGGHEQLVSGCLNLK